MAEIKISKKKMEKVISDFERIITDFEELAEDQDTIAKKRIKDIEDGVEGGSEEELDNYLNARGVKIVDN
ncbi:MAG: hypothetical protein ACOCQX_03150 [Candidatus Nanoarchaeia archaeon]